MGQRKRFMKEKIKYTNGPINKVEVLPDFLPSPGELALREETVKITIPLSKASVEFFKKEAKQHHTHYQKMIGNLVDVYAFNREKFIHNESVKHFSFFI